MIQGFAKVFRVSPLVYGILFIGFFIALAFSYKTGVAFIWPDSLLHAPQGYWVDARFGSAHPIYGFLLSWVHSGGDVAASHLGLILLQTFFLLLGFFPLFAVLKNKSDLNDVQAALLAIGLVLMPECLVYAPLVVPTAFFTATLFWFVYFFDKLTDKEEWKRAGWLAFLSAFLILLSPLGWVVWFAAALALAVKPVGRPLLLLAFAPLLAIAVTGFSQDIIPDLHFNNALARFNFLKNGILFLLYAGLPFAGMVLLYQSFLKGKSFLQDALTRFCVFAVLGALVFAAFHIEVVVSQSLDYFSSRTLEPFLFLAVLPFFRLSETARKESLLNGMLVFFVLAVLGMPFHLHLDMKTGLSFWAQSLANPNLGIIKNIGYLIVLGVPALAIAFFAKRFWLAYMAASFLFIAVGLYASQLWWMNNEDAQLKNMAARNIGMLDKVKTSDGLISDFSCNMETNKDIAYLYRCLDSMKLLYFIPAHIGKGTDEADKNYLKIQTENDSESHPAFYQSGLAKIFYQTGDLAIKNGGQPNVFIKQIAGMGQYRTLAHAENYLRIATIGDRLDLTVDASQQTCAELNLEMGVAIGKPKHFMIKLNDKRAGQVEADAIEFQKIPKALSVKLMLPEGQSVITIERGKQAKAISNLPDVYLFGRPYFRPCNE